MQKTAGSAKEERVSKRVKKDVAPTSAVFILAESIREETGGKFTVLGYFAGGDILIKGPLPKEVAEGKQRMAIPLAILCTFYGAHGEFDLGFQMYSPTGKPMLRAGPVHLVVKPGNAMNLVAPLGNFPVIAWGRYRAEIAVARKVFKFEFVVRHEDPNVQLPVIAATPAKKAPGKRAARKS